MHNYRPRKARWTRDLSDLVQYVTFAREGRIELDEIRAAIAALTQYEKSWNDALAKPECVGRSIGEVNVPHVAHYRTILEGIVRQRRSLGTSTPPGGFALLLACVARPGRADELLGDAEDEYRKVIARLGVGRARWWYRARVLKVFFRMLPWRVGSGVWILKNLFGL